MSYDYERTADVHTAEDKLTIVHIERMASAFAMFVMGNREEALQDLKRLLITAPQVDMQLGGQFATEYEKLRTAFLVAMKRNTAGVTFAK